MNTMKKMFGVHTTSILQNVLVHSDQFFRPSLTTFICAKFHTNATKNKNKK
jgi:hypothetical protein